MSCLRGYELIVPEDCMGALSDYEHEYGLQQYKIRTE